MNFSFILSISPVLEVGIRNLYWRFSLVHRFLSNIKNKQKKYILKNKNEMDKELFPSILNELKCFGVKKNDLLIVHSSWLRKTGLSAEEICKKLITLVGPHGTLAMPAFPILKGELKGINRMDDSLLNDRLNYNVEKSLPWTGVLPMALMGFNGAVRSKHPLNTMVALGKLAQRMMVLNIDGSKPKACGLNSSWKFCVDNDAKIVFLDVEPTHCMTMIHVAEDSYKENGHAPDWYRDRLFTVVTSGEKIDITVKERHPKWSMYYAEKTLQKDLIRAGILKTSVVRGVRVSYCEAKSVLDFIIMNKSKTYPFWIPFWVPHFK